MSSEKILKPTIPEIIIRMRTLAMINIARRPPQQFRVIPVMRQTKTTATLVTSTSGEIMGVYPGARSKNVGRLGTRRKCHKKRQIAAAMVASRVAER
jgi:hypothetical protein